MFDEIIMKYSTVEPQVWMWLMLMCAIGSHIMIGILQIVRYISLAALFVCVTWRLMILYDFPQHLIQHVSFINETQAGEKISAEDQRPSDRHCLR